MYELPGAGTQAPTRAEAGDKLREAVTMILEANRALAEESLRGQKIIKEEFLASA